MENNKKVVIDKRIERTMKALQGNNMTAIYIEKKDDVIGEIKNMISQNDTVSWGGSLTLNESGVIDFLRTGGYNCLDRDNPSLSKEDIERIHINTFFADAYFCSTNAITEDGELYNVDGKSNRVSAMLFGPKKVIIVAGYNKIVKDIDEAVNRVRYLSAPCNTVRLNAKTPCATLGYCGDCKSEERICCNYVIMRQQRHVDRVKVIIVGEELGY